MDKSRLYYSNSLLSAYLDGSNENVSDNELSEQAEHHVPRVPEISVVAPQEAMSNKDAGATLNPLKLTLSRPESYRSQASSCNSLYSSLSNFSDDTDLESVKLKLQHCSLEKPRGNLHKLRQFFKRNGKVGTSEPEDDNALFLHHVHMYWNTKFYHYGKNETLDVNWSESCEVFFFGDTLQAILPNEGDLLRFISESEYELGEVKFSNLRRYHASELVIPEALLQDVLPVINDFNHILDLYAESRANAQKPELYEKLIRDANRSSGLCVPLAIAMFGNWLLSYKKSDEGTSNYDNVLIMNYFRKAARLSIALRHLAPKLEVAVPNFEPLEQILLRRFLNKDTDSALALSLHNLGEYYHHIGDEDTAVTLWELNCHLTGDQESANLAILGLTDGFGLGNRLKERNLIGKKSKTNKFNTKRRIAHIYRILMKRPDYDEYGVSWATKEKYD